MKIKNLFLFIVFIQLMITTSCGENIKPVESPHNKIALNEIKKELKVKDAIINEPNILYVSVEDDGTIRNGYAEYICEVLRENNATTKWVKIVKFDSSKDLNSDNDYGVLLGEAHCN